MMRSFFLSEPAAGNDADAGLFKKLVAVHGVRFHAFSLTRCQCIIYMPNKLQKRPDVKKLTRTVYRSLQDRIQICESSGPPPVVETHRTLLQRCQDIVTVVHQLLEA